jgi:hypothetical protein
MDRSRPGLHAVLRRRCEDDAVTAIKCFSKTNPLPATSSLYLKHQQPPWSIGWQHQLGSMRKTLIASTATRITFTDQHTSSTAGSKSAAAAQAGWFDISQQDSVVTLTESADRRHRPTA